jgi:hypothetical protein
MLQRCRKFFLNKIAKNLFSVDEKEVFREK